jgi:hypothetical protein
LLNQEPVGETRGPFYSGDSVDRAQVRRSHNAYSHAKMSSQPAIQVRVLKNADAARDYLSMCLSFSLANPYNPDFFERERGSQFQARLAERLPLRQQEKDRDETEGRILRRDLRLEDSHNAVSRFCRPSILDPIARNR